MTQENVSNQGKGAIFDLDGTLLDSMGVWDQVDVDFLAKRGFEVRTTTCRRSPPCSSGRSPNTRSHASTCRTLLRLMEDGIIWRVMSPRW